MPRARLFLAGLAGALSITVAAAAWHPPHVARLTAGPPTHPAPPASVEAGALPRREPLAGLYVHVMAGRWYAGVVWHAEITRQELEAAAAARRARPSRFRSTARGGGSGGAFPGDCIAAHESGGNYSAKNPSSSASGKYQVLDSTWDGYAGYPSARSAPAAVQETYARELWAKHPGAWNGTGCPGT